MASNYTLKYRTFDQLLSDVMVDFKKYQSRGLIDNQELIKLKVFVIHCVIKKLNNVQVLLQLFLKIINLIINVMRVAIE